MTRYRGNVEAVRNLVRETEVHRDVYIDDEVFQLEMEHLFANTWIYVGHDSQVSKPGDYFGTTIGTQSVLMVRHTDNTVKVLHNRCPHKGTRITTDTCGNTGKFFRCPYHAWTFRTDGSLFLIPLRKGYENTGLETSHASEGISPVRHVRNYRGFVFAKLNDTGSDFEEFFAESLSASTTWSTAPRLGGSKLPEACCATCTIAIGRCWWRTRPTLPTRWLPMNPRLAPRSRSGRRRRPEPKSQWRSKSTRLSWRHTNFSRTWASVSGRMAMATPVCITRFIPITPPCPGYFERWSAAYGEDARQGDPGREPAQHGVFPQPDDQGSDPADSLFKPIAANKTLVESWTFRLVDAPDMLLERTLIYNRLINAPTSVVGHDDLEMYERAQEGLLVDANQWVNVQRLYDPSERHDVMAVTNGTTEWQMRNQFRAWSKFMTLSM